MTREKRNRTNIDNPSYAWCTFPNDREVGVPVSVLPVRFLESRDGLDGRLERREEAFDSLLIWLLALGTDHKEITEVGELFLDKGNLINRKVKLLAIATH